MKQIIDIQLAGLMKRLEERKIHVAADRRGQGAARPRRVRSELRRAAAEADDSAPCARSAGAAGARGRLPRRRYGRGVDAAGGELHVREARSGQRIMRSVGRRHGCHAELRKPTPRLNPRGGDRRGQRPLGGAAALVAVVRARARRCCSGWRRCTAWLPRRPARPLQRVQDAPEERRGRRGRSSASR